MRRRVPTGVTAFPSPLPGWQPESLPGDRIEPPAEMGGPGEDESDGEDDRDDDSDEAGDDGGNGDEADEGPVADVWLRAFEIPGVSGLRWLPHESCGMAMRVGGGDTTGASFGTPNPENLPEPRSGPVGLARVTLTGPELQPSNIVDRGTVPRETLGGKPERRRRRGGAVLMPGRRRFTRRDRGLVPCGRDADRATWVCRLVRRRLVIGGQGAYVPPPYIDIW